MFLMHMEVPHELAVLLRRSTQSTEGHVVYGMMSPLKIRWHTSYAWLHWILFFALLGPKSSSAKWNLVLDHLSGIRIYYTLSHLWFFTDAVGSTWNALLITRLILQILQVSVQIFWKAFASTTLRSPTESFHRPSVICHHKSRRIWS